MADALCCCDGVGIIYSGPADSTDDQLERFVESFLLVDFVRKYFGWFFESFAPLLHWVKNQTRSFKEF